MTKRAIRFGLLKGRVHVAADFDAPLSLEELGAGEKPSAAGAKGPDSGEPSNTQTGEFEPLPPTSESVAGDSGATAERTAARGLSALGGEAADVELAPRRRSEPDGQ